MSRIPSFYARHRACRRFGVAFIPERLAHPLRPRGGRSFPGDRVSAARLPSGFETEDRRVQRPGRSNGVEILAEGRDLAARGPQEQHILLSIDAPRGLDLPLRLDLRNRAVRVGEGMHLEVEEAEVLDRPQ